METKNTITNKQVENLIKECMALCMQIMSNYELKDDDYQMVAQFYTEAEENSKTITHITDEDKLKQYAEYYEENKEGLKKMLNDLKNKKNSQGTNPNTGASQNAPVSGQKSIVLQSIKALIASAEAAEKMFNTSDPNAFHLRAILNGAREDLASVQSLDDNDPVLNSYLAKITDMQKRVEEIKSNAHRNAPSQNSASENKNDLSNVNILFNVSRNGARVDKDKLVSLISNCKLKLWQLNEDNLIALEDIEAWEALYQATCMDYDLVLNIDPRDKTTLTKLMNKYLILEKDINRLVNDCTSDLSQSKSKGANTPVITKEAVIAKLEGALNTIDAIFDKRKPKFKEKKELNNLSDDIENMIDELKSLDNCRDIRDIRKLDNEANKIIEYLNGYGLTSRHKVTNVNKKDNVSRRTRESSGSILKKILMGTGIALGATAIVWALWIIANNYLGKGPLAPGAQIPSPTPGISQGPSLPSAGMTSSIYDIDLDNETELMNYAADLQTKLPQDSEITIDDIMYAIRLANFENLKDKAVFRERDEVLGSAYFAGKLAKEIGIDSLVQRNASSDIYLSEAEMDSVTTCATNREVTKDDFNVALTANGYDIYAVCQFCLDMMYSGDSRAVGFADVLNDVVARYCVNFSICPDSPVSTYYIIAGMYTANEDMILNLTANNPRGPIYGSGYRIDGTYGNLCAEELIMFMRINHDRGEFVGNCDKNGEPYNALYSYVIDENITNYTNNNTR